MQSNLSLEGLSRTRKTPVRDGGRLRFQYCTWLVDTPYSQSPRNATPDEVEDALRTLRVTGMPESMGSGLVAWVIEYGRVHGLDGDQLVLLGECHSRKPEWFTEADLSWMTVAAAFC